MPSSSSFSSHIMKTNHVTTAAVCNMTLGTRWMSKAQAQGPENQTWMIHFRPRRTEIGICWDHLSFQKSQFKAEFRAPLGTQRPLRSLLMMVFSLNNVFFLCSSSQLESSDTMNMCTYVKRLADLQPDLGHPHFWMNGKIVWPSVHDPPSFPSYEFTQNLNQSTFPFSRNSKESEERLLLS